MANEPIKMQRDSRDEWPQDVPIGTFDIDMKPYGVQDYVGITAHIIFVCPKGRRCGVFLGPKFVNRPTEDKSCIWGWDGNIEQPTLTPSINCIAEKNGKPTGGCGWHGWITAGVIR